MTRERPPLGGPFPYGHYDRRNYKTVSIEEGYAIWSRKYGDFYDCFDIDLFERSPLLMSRIEGSRVIDFACGNGRVGKWVMNAGASAVVGVDRSAEMMAHAVERRVYERTVMADITATGLPDASFDGGITSMALCHVPDLFAFFGEASRLIRPGGWLAVLDFHPFFLFMGIPTHFDPLEGGEPIAIENHVHPLSRFYRAASETGFVLREMEERFVDSQWVEKMPKYHHYLGWPITHYWAFEKLAIPAG